MKVVCVNKNRFSEKEITIGKTYELIQYEAYGEVGHYFISDDGFELLYFDNDKDFITLEQYREQQLNKIGI